MRKVQLICTSALLAGYGVSGKLITTSLSYQSVKIVYPQPTEELLINESIKIVVGYTYLLEVSWYL